MDYDRGTLTLAPQEEDVGRYPIIIILVDTNLFPDSSNFTFDVEVLEIIPEEEKEKGPS